MKVLEAKGLTKIFPGVVALDRIDISFEKGRIHCVVGENGAGKSTLIKCLTGIYKADEGSIYINGELAKEDAGLFSKVVFVPQEIDLFQHLSVAENLFIPFEQTNINGLIHQRKLEEIATDTIKRFGIHAGPGQLVRELSVADQQLLQIARATMRKGYEIMILDEPTSSLTMEDANRVFRVVRQQKEAGIAVVYISHKLNEIFQIGDDITVFRNGQKIDTALVNEIDENWIIQKMIGKHLSEEQRFYSNGVTDEELLRVEHLYGSGFRDISFTLKKGEILGFSGLIGAGRSELMRAIYGSNRIYSGKIYYKNKQVRQISPANSVASGLVYLPEDRKRTGILPLMSVKGNISILSIKNMVVNGVVSQKQEDAKAKEFAKLYDVRTPGLDRKIQTLSGGNQQKAIIARSMLAKPQVIILDEPTKGIDVGAKYEIYKLMKTLAENGLGVIFVSSELDEILQCCNRIIVMHEEQIVGEFSKDPNKESIMNAIIGCPA